MKTGEEKRGGSETKPAASPAAGRRLRVAVVVALVLLCAAAAGAPRQKKGPIQASGLTYFVNVYSVTRKLGPKGGTLFEVGCRYNFTDRKQVFIPGRGLASASGSFRLHVAADELVFLESKAGRPLVSLKLYEIDVPQGDVEMEVPEKGQFPEAFASRRWPEPETFPEAAEAVLKAHFPEGFLAAEIEGDDYYLTTYRDLPVAARVKAQVALAVSRPRSDGGLVYRVQYLARERDPGRTEWRYGGRVSAATDEAAREFAAVVLSRFARPPAGP
jgi:hypothetical protein